MASTPYQCAQETTDNITPMEYQFAQTAVVKNQTIEAVFEEKTEKIEYKINCSKHNRVFEYHCKKCQVNICAECVQAGHQSHEIEEVSSHSKLLRENFSKKINSTISQVEKMKEQEMSILNSQMKVKEHTKAQIEMVRTKIEKKKQALEKEGERIIENLKREEEDAVRKLQAQQKKLQDLDEQVQRLIDSIGEKLSTFPDGAIFDFVTEKEKELKTLRITDLKFELPNPSDFKLAAQKEESGLLRSLISVPSKGFNLQINEPQAKTLTVKDFIVNLFPSPSTERKKVHRSPSLADRLKVKERFSRLGVPVVSICSTNDDNFWVGRLDSQLSLISKKGKEKRKVKMEGPPFYTAVTENGDVVVSTGGHCMYKVTRAGLKSTFVEILNDTLRDIITTTDGDVFAYVQSGLDCKIQKFSPNGQFELELDTTKFKTRHQLHIHITNDDKVCVQDGRPGFDPESYLSYFTASGQFVSSVPRTKELALDADDIIWDQYGHMLIGTSDDENILVFNEEGTFTKKYKVSGSGGVKALSLGKGRNDMWIGTKNGDVLVAEYLQ